MADQVIKAVDGVIDVNLKDEDKAFSRALRSDLVVIFTGFFALLGTCFTAYVGYKVAELNQRTAGIVNKQEAIAVNVAEIGVTTEKTHKLTNSAMEAQLKLNADLSDWKASEIEQRAEETNKESDVTTAGLARKEADAARKRYEEHVAASKSAEVTTAAPAM